MSVWVLMSLRDFRCESPTLSGGKRLLRPAGIARVPGVKLRITRRAPAVDKQCALDARRGGSALQYSCIIKEAVPGNTRIGEHNCHTRRARSFVEDGQKGIGRITFETVLALCPLFQKHVVANLAHDSLGAFREERGRR